MSAARSATASALVRPAAGDPSASASSTRLLRVLATAGAMLVLVIIVASAYLRLSAAGLSCADWPACYGRMSAAVAPSIAARIVRVAHRLAATGTGAIMLVLVGTTVVMRPRRPWQMSLALAGLGVVVGLAVLGIATAKIEGPPLPAVTLANLLGGFVLLALIVALRATTAQLSRTIVPRRLRTLAFVALLVVAIQVVLGAFVSARFAGLACPTFPLCGAEAPPGSLAATLDPFAPLTVAGNTLVRPAALAALQSAHRVGAHAVLFVAIALAIGLLRTRAHALAAVVIAPVVVELALGASSVVFELPLFVVLAHNFVAALLLATFAALNVRWRALPPPPLPAKGGGMHSGMKRR